MELETAIFWTHKLIAFAVFLQTIELLLLRETYDNQGVWRWSTLRDEFRIFSSWQQKFIAYFLSYPNFNFLLFGRLLLSCYLLMSANLFVLVALLFSTVMIALRWRGTFNGGSDYMTVIVLSSLTAGSIFQHSEKVELAVLWYIAIQVCSSYSISGLAKLRNSNWRSGFALRGFLASTIYNDNKLSQIISKNEKISLLLSWIIILFEVSFFAVLFSPLSAQIFILIAIVFHLGNFYLFGLNRFVFAWSACYPALIFCSDRLF